MNELRCGNCKYWLGESALPLVHVEHVETGNDVELRPPRDLRLCKQCGRVNVFILKEELDLRRTAQVS